MSRSSRLLILVLATALLVGCKAAPVKADLPRNLIKPTIVYVDRYVYVPIKSALTEEQPIAEGPLDQCPIVAKQRKVSLLKANAQLRAISTVQGTDADR